MIYKNGYKVVYEVAAGGKRTFYAATSSVYPNRDEAGNITDTVLATFNDTDFYGKTIYEYKGEFYVSNEALPKYNEDGTPHKDEVKLNFDEILVKKEGSTSTSEEPVAETTEPADEEETGDNEVTEE